MAETSAQASSAPSPSAAAPLGFPIKRRQDSSLHLLAQRFVKLLWFSVDGSMDLGMAAKELSAPRRRLYDITNVLQGIGLIQKTSASRIKWLGNADSMYADLLEVLTEEEQELDEQIQTCTCEVFQLRMDQTNWRFAYLTYEDLQSIPSLKEQTVLVIKAPVDTTLEVPNPEESLQVHLRSTKGPIEVLLSSDDPVPVGTTDASPARGFNGTLPNRNVSHSSSPRTSAVQVSSKGTQTIHQYSSSTVLCSMPPAVRRGGVGFVCLPWR
ncbi:transcription factor E2F3-like [Genypterus blacodes]|uniref:transcription factor E2F3-like n=1 Tax=Genypterus blacodes TaxID=154954 RepID=UPI003F75DA6C